MIDDLQEHHRTFVKATPSDWHDTEAFQGPGVVRQLPIGGSYAVDRPTAKDRPGCDHMRSTKRMCVVCCVVRPAPQHELLRAAAGGAQAAWVWLCSGCVDQYRRSRVILRSGKGSE